MVQQHADDTRRDRGDGEQQRVAPVLATAPHDAAGDAPQPASVHHEHRSQRRHMQGDLDEDAGEFDAGQGFHQHQVPRAGNGQKLRQPLDQAQHEALPQVHATRPRTSATSPTTMAPLSNRLRRSVLPTKRRLAAASTASWEMTATA